MAEQMQPGTTLALMQEMRLGEEEITRRKAFLEFGPDDIEQLHGVHDLASEYAEGVIEDFYSHLSSFEESKQFFTDSAVLARVKAT